MSNAISGKVMDALKGIGNQLPAKGDKVDIIRGRNKGKSGVIFWSNPHGKIHHGGRYGSATENCIADSFGASLRIGLKTEDGEKIFVNYADHIRQDD